MALFQQFEGYLQNLVAYQGFSAGAEIDSTGATHAFLGERSPDFLRRMLKPGRRLGEQSLLGNITVAAPQVTRRHRYIAIQKAFYCVHFFVL